MCKGLIAEYCVVGKYDEISGGGRILDDEDIIERLDAGREREREGGGIECRSASIRSRLYGFNAGAVAGEGEGGAR